MSVSSQPPRRKTNHLGLTMADYRGGPSTLCPGCGHDAITSQLIKACYQLGVNPYKVAKMSGIGCSSKTPAYFLGVAQGFNTVHGRMPSVATGVLLANRQLLTLGVSGDGDTASIGLGQFCHLMRRNVPMIYIVENNGVYGLTKGQFSATADRGATQKSGVVNETEAIDICSLALEMGCTYIGRSFAADPKQVVALLEGAIGHGGTAVLDIISPCVTFNDHAGSTKSYAWGKEHEELLHEIDFIPHFEPLEAIEVAEGEVHEVELHDGSHLRLRKVERDHDPTDRAAAYRVLQESKDAAEFLTGLIYVNPAQENFLDQLDLVEAPLAHLTEQQLRPSPEVFEKILREHQ